MKTNKINKTIEDLENEAFEKGLEVDWETASLREPPMRKMTPSQRDLYADKLSRQRFYKELNDLKDNDPASPEQAGW